MRKFCLFFLSVNLFLFAHFQSVNAQSDSTLKIQNQWVDSVYQSLTLEQKIAQLFVVRANQADKDYDPEIDKYIKDYNIGGVTFFRNDAVRQLEKTKEWQSLAQTPLFISMDAEWGVGMRLNEVIKFPYQMTLGAIQNDSLIYEMGTEIAKQCERMGIQMNFAPVIDININPKNPVINSRSFGENKQNVANKGLMYMKGLQDNGVLAIAKHFPGHGDTDIDSHQSLPIINHTKLRLDSIELFPFKSLINNGLDGMMIAHLYIPAYETQANTASTLSTPIVTDLLKKELRFNGLVVTDALDMSGVTKYFKPGDIEQTALEAGNDILLLPQDVPKAIRIIKRAVEKGTITEDRINESCKKILSYKFKAGLAKSETPHSNNLLEDLNNQSTKYLIQKLYENAITIVKNTDSLLPLKRLDTLRIASVGIGYNAVTKFQKRLSNYAAVEHFYLPKESSQEEQKKLVTELSGFNLVIIGIQNTSIYPSNNFGISQSSLNFIDSIQKLHPVVLDIFANPYSLSLIKNDTNLKSIVMSYEDNEMVYDLSAQLIFGGFDAKGKLPVSASEIYPVNSGIVTAKTRIKYSCPEELGIDPKSIEKVDSIAISGITEKAYPGCQILAIKDGVVFYHKAFGNHTFLTNNPVKQDDLYDVASITKIAATTISIMKLYENKQIDVDQRLSDYLPYLKYSNKENMIVRDVMTHQAGLQAWIPYYMSTLNKNELNQDIYSKQLNDAYTTRVAENLYIRSDYKYAIIDSIILSPLREKNDYKYSDLGFYLLASAIENITNRSVDKYVDQYFYKPLGLNDISYLPRFKYPLSRIVPTEEDTQFRHQLIHGDVHDPGAAMLGGISGHAGLFSDANDLAVILQMLINGGTYGGQKYLNNYTIKEFTKCQFPLNENRRGIGFDKPLLQYEEDGAVCYSASNESFGHSGFTGTYAWADPKNNLIYIFLSNRIHPDAANSKIMDLNIRTNIHEAFYEAIKKTNTIK